jgi:TonB-dependent starch-binding outer membrane protein SusC
MMMRKLYPKLSLTAVLLFMLTSVILAQERNVSGKVSDETGSGMPGVNVIVKGTTNGTTSDVDGNFTIAIPNDQATLIFSFVGYATSEVIVGSRTSVEVQLTTDVQTLTELVVTGYQVQRKADISGAVAVVKAEELQSLVASSFAQKLQGRAPGVTVSTSGAPGDATNVRIRGISSFGNNDPLYVIDGVQVVDKGNLNINPNDVESMQVLKDPSTAAIYGSRGANGVIVITTKQGKAGKTKLTYNGSFSLVNSVKGWDDILITDSNEYLDMSRQFFDNGSQARPKYAEDETLPKYIYVNSAFVDGTNTVTDNVDESTYNRYDNPIMLGSPGTNWWDAITRTGQVQDHSINVSGGNDAAVFSIAAGYLKQEGVLEYNSFKRYTIRANSAYKLGNKVRIGQTLNYANRERINNPAQSEQGVLSQVYKIAPIIPVYDIGTSVDDQGYRDSFGGSKTASTGNANNPYAVLFRGRRNPQMNNSLMGNLYGEIDVIKGLTYRTDVKYDYGQFNNKTFSYRSPENQENQGAQNFQENWGTNFTWIWTNSLSYTKSIGDNHKIAVFAGYEALRSKFRNINSSLNNYFTTDPNVWYINAAFGAADTRQTNTTGAENTLASMFGKVDYSFADKYYISATIRRDGSSRFAESKRYATFPAFSAAWRVTGESFLANNGILTDFKLRASWGRTGNENIPSYNFADRWGGTVGSAFYDINGTNSAPVTGYHLTNLGSPDTRWEEAETTNFGFDASLFDDKLTVVLDIYTRDTNYLLYNAELPGTVGYLAPNAPFRNTASMTNKGFDLGIGYNTNIGSEVKFSADVNVSHYKNKINEIDGITNFFYPNALQGRIDNRLPQQININQIGYSISSFRGYMLDGMIDDAAELASIDQPGAAVGGLKFKDLNGDGRITDADLTIIGNPHPDLTVGLNLSASYKNFELTAFFFGSFGNDIFNYTKLFTHFRQFYSNVDRDYYKNNGKGGVPRLNAVDTSSRQASEYYVEDGSYVRLGQLQLAYNVPVPTALKGTLGNLRLYVQGQNLFTITDYSGLDPALSNANIGDFNQNIQGNFLNDMWTGFDIGQYPSNKIVTFGVSAQF